MDTTDRTLLQGFVGHNDPEAFSAIVRQYAGLVYGTGRRVLGNDAQAADVAQETFLDFLNNARPITGSLAAWLHRVATRRALDSIRQSTARRQREEAYVLVQIDRERDWSDIEPLVDQALEELPEEWREVLLLHYLKGLTMTQIAAATGQSQPTVSRRVAAALEHLRHSLRARDVTVSSLALGSLLANSVQSAPAYLLESLGKISLTQAALSITGTAVPALAPTLATGTKMAMAIAALALVTGTGWLMTQAHFNHQSQTSRRPPIHASTPSQLSPVETRMVSQAAPDPPPTASSMPPETARPEFNSRPDASAPTGAAIDPPKADSTDSLPRLTAPSRNPITAELFTPPFIPALLPDPRSMVTVWQAAFVRMRQPEIGYAPNFARSPIGTAPLPFNPPSLPTPIRRSSPARTAIDWATKAHVTNLPPQSIPESGLLPLIPPAVGPGTRSPGVNSLVPRFIQGRRGSGISFRGSVGPSSGPIAPSDIYRVNPAQNPPGQTFP
jgi:RNA polymerase sigma factor (sigma-70 family)